MLRRVWMASALLVCATPVLAQQYENARRLGGATAFYKPPLTNAASLKRMADRQANDIRTVLRDAGIPEVADAFLAAMSKGSSTIAAGNCANVPPGDGLVECTEPVGSMYEWMAERALVKGKRVPSRIQRVRWAGKQSFLAFLVRVTVSDKLYTFIVPKPCGNFSLVSVADSAQAVAAREQAARDQAARDQAARDQAARDQAARDQAARDQAARDQTARNAAPAPNAGAQTAPGAGAPGSAQTTSTSSAGSTEKPTPFFADVLLGGERRNRPADLIEGKRTDFTQGSGFIGLKIGAAKKFDNNWELGGAVGMGAMFLFKHDTINQWPWFAELEVNRYIGDWFVGTGFSIWDFTRSDLWTPSADIRFGIPLGHHPKHPIVFLGEGRWYLDHRT